MKKAIVLMLLANVLVWQSTAFAQANNGQPDTGTVQNAFGSSLIKGRPTESKIRPSKAESTGNLVDDGDTLRITTNLVVSDVSVFDKRGWAVKGLSRNDFRVQENGEEQQIEVFAFAGDQSAIPRSIVLIIDYSGSQAPYIKTSVDAAKVLVDMLHSNDKMALVTDDVEKLLDFTSDKELLKQKLESLETRAREGKVGKSRQFSALFAVLNEMFREGDLRPKIIFQTDGDEYGLISRRLFNIGEANRIEFSYDDILKSAERAGTTIYSVIPGPDFRTLKDEKRRELARQDLENQMRLYAAQKNMVFVPHKKGPSQKYLDHWAEAREQNSKAVARVATATGGVAQHLEQPENATAVYARILAEMNQRYVIGYYPTNETRDGKRRKIKITTPNGSDHKIYGRTSYIAPTPDH